MKKVLLSLCIICLAVILTGCGKSNKLIGTWKGATEDGMKTTWTFEKKDKVSYENEYGIKSEGTYTISDNIVSISLEVWDSKIDYEFQIKDKKLYLTASNKYSPSYMGLEKIK